MSLAFAAVQAEDFEALLALRMAAMRPSLEAMGRFDPARARERFAGQFHPDAMRWIEAKGARVGLLTVHRECDPWYVQHLYIAPGHQDQGLGRRALVSVQREAAAAGVAVELEALNGSAANRFYQRRGFQVLAVEELDTRYRWEPPR
jgi:ribosomal protein S18 acetylase RimI-like enzyme